MGFNKHASSLIAFLLVSVFAPPALAGPRKGNGTGDGTAFFNRSFQVAFVGRVSNNPLDGDRFVEIVEGGAESLQIPVPGVIIGRFSEEFDFNTIVEPPGAPESDLQISTRGRLMTRLGSLSWEATMRIVFLDANDPDGIEAATYTEHGTITGGTGIYKGATGTVEVAGYLEGCDLGEDHCAWSWSVTPDFPSRGRRFDSNYILRGNIQ